MLAFLRALAQPGKEGPGGMECFSEAFLLLFFFFFSGQAGRAGYLFPFPFCKFLRLVSGGNCYSRITGCDPDTGDVSLGWGLSDQMRFSSLPGVPLEIPRKSPCLTIPPQPTGFLTSMARNGSGYISPFRAALQGRSVRSAPCHRPPILAKWVVLRIRKLRPVILR